MRYVHQIYAAPARLTAFDAGLIAARTAGAGGGAVDVAVRVEAILARMRVAHRAHRMIRDLSGGRQQIVTLAQGLMPPTPVLLLDEPASALDLRHQLEALALLRATALADGVSRWWRCTTRRWPRAKPTACCGWATGRGLREPRLRPDLRRGTALQCRP